MYALGAIDRTGKMNVSLNTFLNNAIERWIYSLPDSVSTKKTMISFYRDMEESVARDITAYAEKRHTEMRFYTARREQWQKQELKNKIDNKIENIEKIETKILGKI